MSLHRNKSISDKVSFVVDYQGSGGVESVQTSTNTEKVAAILASFGNSIAINSRIHGISPNSSPSYLYPEYFTDKTREEISAVKNPATEQHVVGESKDDAKGADNKSQTDPAINAFPESSNHITIVASSIARAPKEADYKHLKFIHTEEFKIVQKNGAIASVEGFGLLFVDLSSATSFDQASILNSCNLGISLSDSKGLCSNVIINRTFGGELQKSDQSYSIKGLISSKYLDDLKVKFTEAATDKKIPLIKYGISMQSSHNCVQVAKATCVFILNSSNKLSVDINASVVINPSSTASFENIECNASINELIVLLRSFHKNQQKSDFAFTFQQNSHSAHGSFNSVTNILSWKEVDKSTLVASKRMTLTASLTLSKEEFDFISSGITTKRASLQQAKASQSSSSIAPSLEAPLKWAVPVQLKISSFDRSMYASESTLSVNLHAAGESVGHPAQLSSCLSKFDFQFSNVQWAYE